MSAQSVTVGLLPLELGFIRPAFTGRDTSRGIRMNSTLRHLRGIALRGIEASPLQKGIARSR